MLTPGLSQSCASTAKRLIVNADDFGLAQSVNLGIVKAFNEGILTSASLMVNGPAFQNAVELVRQYPGLDIGLHLTLNEERPLLLATEIPTLVESNGYLCKSPQMLGLGLLAGRIRRQDVEKELRAQIEKALRLELPISHIDSHKHIHTMPQVLDIVIRLLEEYSLRVFLRCPCETLGVLKLLARPAPGKLLKTSTLSVISALSWRRLRPKDVLTCDHFYGVLHSGQMLRGVLGAILLNLRPGLTEIMCHPGYANGQLARRYRHWGPYDWQAELDGLISPPIWELINKLDIHLTSFGEVLKRSAPEKGSTYALA